MKIKFLFILLISGLTIGSQAQTFSLINLDTLSIDSVGSVPSCHAKIQNNSSTGYYIDVLRALNDTAPSWQTAFCLDVCYPPQVDSARFYLASDSTQSFLLEFFSGPLPDTSKALMTFRNVSDPTNSISQYYYGITDLTFGIHENITNNVVVKLYPNPVAPGSTFSFNISDKTGRLNDFSLLIHDIYGRTTTRFDQLGTGDNFLSLQLPQGIYIYTLLHGNKRLKTGKILVSR